MFCETEAALGALIKIRGRTWREGGGHIKAKGETVAVHEQHPEGITWAISAATTKRINKTTVSENMFSWNIEF